MENVTPTVYGAAIQTALLLGIHPEFEPMSTMNQWFEVFGTDALLSTDKYSMNYFALGNGGTINRTKADGFPGRGYHIHEPGDVRPFKPFPFIMRRLSEPLSTNERTRYAMRKIEEFGGILYECYYLRRMDKTGLKVNKYRMTAAGGSGVFTPDNDNFNPVPITTITSTGETIVATGDYLSASAPYVFTISESEAAELRNCAEIRHNDEDYATVSEIVCVCGADRIKTGQGAGTGTVNYNEAICAQALSYLITDISFVINNKGYAWTVDLGATEPLPTKT
jgi:hypothetical protein